MVTLSARDLEGETHLIEEQATAMLSASAMDMASQSGGIAGTATPCVLALAMVMPSGMIVGMEMPSVMDRAEGTPSVQAQAAVSPSAEGMERAPRCAAVQDVAMPLATGMATDMPNALDMDMAKRGVQAVGTESTTATRFEAPSTSAAAANKAVLGPAGTRAPTGERGKPPSPRGSTTPDENTVSAGLLVSRSSSSSWW